MSIKLPFYGENMNFHPPKDYGLYALMILAEYHHIPFNPEDIKHKFDINGTGLDLTSWLMAAKSLDLKAKIVKKPIDISRITIFTTLIGHFCEPILQITIQPKPLLTNLRIAMIIC